MSKVSIVFVLFALVAICAFFGFAVLYLTEADQFARDGYRYCACAMLFLCMLFYFMSSIAEEHEVKNKY